jgi:small subunit ribosomal protein S17
MQTNTRKTKQGIVVSDKMDKTIVVRVDDTKAHAKYGKTIRVSNKFHAHDEKKEAKVGDEVIIMETRRLSKTKNWRLLSIKKHKAVVNNASVEINEANVQENI